MKVKRKENADTLSDFQKAQLRLLSPKEEENEKMN
jgi:hypothetical protein